MTAELQMPNNYVLIDNEEMEYLDGGGNGWWNSTWFVGGAINGLLYLVAPSIQAASKSLKAGSTLGRALSWAGATKNTMVNAAVKLLTKVGFKVTASTVTRAVGAIWAFSGLSIGSIIANGIDKVDCNRNNGYVFG